MKRVFTAAIIALCLAAMAVPAQSGSVDKQIMHYLFDGQLDSADSLINLQIKKNPDHPKYYFLKAHYNFYMRYSAQRNVSRDSILQIIIDNAQKAVDLEDQVAETTENKFYIGSAYGFLSRAYIMRQETWSGYWAGRDCRNYLEEVLEEDPSYYDAYLGLGVIEYYPARLTGWQGFLAWMGGMSGNREKGLEYFKKTAEKGDLLKTEATFILATMYRFLENDYTQANIYLSQLREKFPHNNFIANIHEQAKLAQLIEEKGVDFLETSIDSLRNKYNITNSGVLNGMGYSFMGREQYELAVAVFKLNIKLYPDQANPYDSISECYQNQENNEMAIKYAKIGLQKLPADTTVADEFRGRLKEILETRLNDLGADDNI
jgi:tetratricopeptide (TPR) repeat protein